MHFITKKTSETGKKFQKIADKIAAINKAEKALAIEIGFDKWRPGYWTGMGGFSALIFKKAPDKKVYKSVNGNEWMPRLTYKEGKAIQAKLDACPVLEKKELNECIGFYGDPFKSIGFAQTSKEYFGFIVQQEWDVKIPEDCEEVTTTRYNDLFEIGKAKIK